MPRFLLFIVDYLSLNVPNVINHLLAMNSFSAPIRIDDSIWSVFVASNAIAYWRRVTNTPFKAIMKFSVGNIFLSMKVSNRNHPIHWHCRFQVRRDADAGCQREGKCPNGMPSSTNGSSIRMSNCMLISSLSMGTCRTIFCLSIENSIDLFGLFFAVATIPSRPPPPPSSSSSSSSIGSNSLELYEGKSSSSHPPARKDKTTRMRTVLNEKQLLTLRTCYSANPRPDALMKEQLVEMTQLSPRVIRVWFQNKRSWSMKFNCLTNSFSSCAAFLFRM